MNKLQEKSFHRRGAETLRFLFDDTCGTIKEHIKSFSLRIRVSAVNF